MIIESYYYGPEGKGFETTQGLRSMVSEKIIQELYPQESPHGKTRVFDKVYQTKNGPVIGITRIRHVNAKDNRNYVENRTIFIRYNDVIADLKKQLDKPVPHPIQVVSVTLQ